VITQTLFSGWLDQHGIVFYPLDRADGVLICKSVFSMALILQALFSYASDWKEW